MSSKAQTREKDYERGIRIADRRKAIGLSQDELAHRVGIGRQALSAIENGGDFKTQTLDNLAIVLGVSVDFIMYGKNEENSELLSEAMDVLSDMDELQIRQCLAMMKAMKSVSWKFLFEDGCLCGSRKVSIKNIYVSVLLCKLYKCISVADTCGDFLYF